MIARFIVLCLTCILLVVPARAQDFLSPDDIDRISRSIVMVEALRDGRPIGTGSGTIVRSNGLIFTNRHVLEGADDFAIYMLEDPNELPVLRYYASVTRLYPTNVGSTDLDFATLQINRDEAGNALTADELTLPALDAENFGEVRRGDRVFVFGYPGIGEGYLVFTDGIITTVQNSTIGGERIATLYQTSAEIAPGNSGGLAVNADGLPVGIPTIVNTEQETGGRLGGIQPFVYLEAVINSGVRADVPDPGEIIESELTQPSSDDLEELDEFYGVAVSCGSSRDILNGVEIVVLGMRPNFQYAATVIGLGDFDPLLAVTPTANTLTYGQAQDCNDDSPTASSYAVDLPTTGAISGDRFDSHLEFSHRQGAQADISLIVGEYDGNPGEFLLILEGMAVTVEDDVGDLFVLIPTLNVSASGTPVSVYQIGLLTPLDPLFFVYNADTEDILRDLEGRELDCDDANTGGCYSNSEPLTGSSVTLNGRTVRADRRDAMLSFDPMNLEDVLLPLPFVMTSFAGESTGEYVVVFHIGLS